MRRPIRENSTALDGTNDKEAEVHRREKHVLRSNDEAPSRPNGTGSHKSGVLCERQLLGGTEKVRCSSKDDTPFHDGCPEMHRLDPDLTGPQSLEQALRLGGCALNSRACGCPLPSSEDLSELEGFVGRLSSGLLREAHAKSGGHYQLSGCVVGYGVERGIRMMIL